MARWPVSGQGGWQKGKSVTRKQPDSLTGQRRKIYAIAMKWDVFNFLVHEREKKSEHFTPTASNISSILCSMTHCELFVVSQQSFDHLSVTMCSYWVSEFLLCLSNDVVKSKSYYFDWISTLSAMSHLNRGNRHFFYISVDNILLQIPEMFGLMYLKFVVSH